MVGRLAGALLALVACRGDTRVTELRSCHTPTFCAEYVGEYDDEAGLHELCAVERGTVATGGCEVPLDAKGTCVRVGAKRVFYASYPQALDEISRHCTESAGTFTRGKDPDHQLWLQR